MHLNWENPGPNRARHGPDLPIPYPPHTLNNISDDLDQMLHSSCDN